LWAKPVVHRFTIVRAATCVVETALVWQLVIWVGVISTSHLPIDQQKDSPCHARKKQAPSWRPPSKRTSFQDSKKRQGPKPVTERGERSERGDRSERTERSDRAPRKDYAPRQDRARGDNRPARAERPERFDRNEKSDRPAREGGYDRAPRTDRPAREGGYDRSTRQDRPAREGGYDRAPRTDRPAREGGYDRAPRHNSDERSARPDRAPRHGSSDRSKSYGSKERFDSRDSQRSSSSRPTQSRGDYPSQQPRGQRPQITHEALEAISVTADSAEGLGFGDLGLGERIVDAIREQGATTPFALQAATIPIALEGRHVLGRGRTGSGKTIAFAAPTVERLSAIEQQRSQASRGSCTPCADSCANARAGIAD